MCNVTTRGSRVNSRQGISSNSLQLFCKPKILFKEKCLGPDNELYDPPNSNAHLRNEDMKVQRG